MPWRPENLLQVDNTFIIIDHHRKDASSRFSDNPAVKMQFTSPGDDVSLIIFGS